MNRRLKAFPRLQSHGFHPYCQLIMGGNLVEILRPINQSSLIGGINI